ncbi:hypothetical protein [Streptomyces fuscichromogenes]|uniref:Uncharacterized protein n=1 Tax=Streptomyces fuscichromogenes TaxID=1324013 RepID=A0A917XQ05_9ACTN|nr:hypothetical protein [Streptomyces fuscichromogenes]GGN46293.1 hypothetical protein GCM10011578_099070 [Streptomyces fuscichromogenes]
MNTAVPDPATTPVAHDRPIWAGRPGVRLYTITTAQPRALAKADAEASDRGNGAHVHQSVTDDLYVVVRPANEGEEGQP